MIMATACQKGGVGKTTTVVNVATVLAMKNKRVCIVDFDPQGNASVCFGVDPDSLSKSIYHIFTGEAQIEDILIKTKFGVDIVPSNEDLSQLDMLILQNMEAFKSPAHTLREALAPIRDKYDYILIDLPPSLSLLTVNGLAAADEVLIPLQCEYLATSGVNKLLRSIENVKQSYNPSLRIRGIVATMFNGRTNLSSVILQEARRHFDQTGIKLFDTTISRSVKFGEAPMSGQPAVIHYRREEAIQDYRRLTEEMFAV